MVDQPQLSDAESKLVLELLERELKELPTEIRHTRVAAYREKLHERLEMVENLVGRLRDPATV